jgi:hypothetical protein
MNREFCFQSELSEEKWKEANGFRTGSNPVVRLTDDLLLVVLF